MTTTIEPPTLLLLAGILLFVMTLFRLGKRGGRPPAATPSPIKPTSPLSVARVADDLEVKLYNTFRELNARLENKMQAMNDLINESEGKIRRLEQLQQRQDKSSSVEGPTVLNIESAGSASPLPPAERFAEIYQMEDRGMTPAEISQRVDQPLGEIQLILGLRKRRKSG
ncbi:hypothetical protein K2X85_16640 [bacterium]|nr:hypothetical protein [bacterium]